MYKLKLKVLLIVALLSGCATSGHGDFCDTASPIYLTYFDTLTPDTARQILKHNETGEALCGW